VERFNLRKLNELYVRKQYQIKISNRTVALKNLSESEDINRVWKNIKGNIKTSSKECLGLYTKKQNHGLMKNVYIFWIKGNRLKCSSHKIQTKAT
jgi:hypothetical protein